MISVLIAIWNLSQVAAMTSAIPCRLLQSLNGKNVHVDNLCKPRLWTLRTALWHRNAMVYLQYNSDFINKNMFTVNTIKMLDKELYQLQYSKTNGDRAA